MPKVVIHKDGEHPLLESPELPLEVCEQQEQAVGRMISVLHADTSGFIQRTEGFDGVGALGPDVHEPNRIDAMCDLGWCQIAGHVVRDVEITGAKERR